MNKTTLQTSQSEVVYYQLEKVRFIIKDATELDIAYAYDDLVFSEHGLFIIQFNKKSEDVLSCWFNKDCEDDARFKLFKSLTSTAKLNNLKINYSGKFEMIQKEGEDQISLKFTKEYMLDKQTIYA